MQLVFESTSHTLVGKGDLPYKPGYSERNPDSDCNVVDALCAPRNA